MLYTEKGVLPGSEMFYSTTIHEINELYYVVPNCGYFFCDEHFFTERKKHFDCLMCYILKGTLYVGNEKRIQAANAGDIVLLNCSVPHKYYCTGSTEFIYLHYGGSNSIDITEYLIKRNDGFVFKTTEADKIKNLCMKLIAKLKNMQPVSTSEYSQTIYSVLCLLSEKGTADVEEDTYISRAKKFISENVYNKITLDDISENVHISKFYLTRIFKKETGVTPMAYVTVTKMNAAKTMLKTTRLSVIDIAYKLGYSSSASFINIFINHVGISPSQFRKFPI